MSILSTENFSVKENHFLTVVFHLPYGHCTLEWTVGLSVKTEASEPKKWTGTQFGQWDTAGFENEEQKLKFLKLMGGFKHLSPIL